MREELVVSRLEDIGKVREKLKLILEDDIFDNLSKHNPYFDSEHQKESDKLYDLRCKISYIHDKLLDIQAVLEIDM